MAGLAHADDHNPACAFEQGLAGVGETLIQPLPQCGQSFMFSGDNCPPIRDERGFGHAGKITCRITDYEKTAQVNCESGLF
jgi:hypothetical protein